MRKIVSVHCAGSFLFVCLHEAIRGNMKQYKVLFIQCYSFFS